MISERGAALIQEFEGTRLSAYTDPGTGGEPITIGTGHTGGVKLGDTCTEEQALEWLRVDCVKAERAIDLVVSVPLNQNQRDALISLVYNIGAANFSNSTLLRLLNAGDYESVHNQFKRWNKAGGKVLAGLVRRRAAEASLFAEPPC